MNLVRKKRLLLFLLCLFCFSSFAKAEEDAYVELLIFRHTDLGQHALGTLLETHGTTATSPIARLSFSTETASTSPIARLGFSTETASTTELASQSTLREHSPPPAGSAGGPRFSLVTAEKRQSLTDVKKRLEGSSHFALLHHLSWRQALLDAEHSLPVSLLPSRPQTGLYKAVAELSFSRYFRLQLELWYSPALPGSPPGNQETSERVLPVRFSEVMDNDKLYYFDHQLLGVLAIARTE